MNKQTGKKSILWTRIWGREGFTCNPSKGCKRGCAWGFGDEIAICYAKTMADRIAAMNDGKGHYSQGFDHVYFDENEINAIRSRKTPSGIFLGSMTDVYDSAVTQENLQTCIDVMTEMKQHIFFTLTKHAPRLLHFKQPVNNFVGISTPPDMMYGEYVSGLQKSKWFDVALSKLGQVKTPIRWLSIEPLSATGEWGEDLIALLKNHAGSYEWVVIGAGTHKGQAFMPDPYILRGVVDAVHSAGASIWFKSNIPVEFAVQTVGYHFQSHPTKGDFEYRLQKLERAGVLTNDEFMQAIEAIS